MTRTRRVVTWLAMIVAPWLWGYLASTLGLGVGMLFGPTLTFAIALAFLRPRRRPPELADDVWDWGRNWGGQAWLTDGSTTYWVSGETIEALRTARRPVEPEVTIDGFYLQIPRHGHGLPDITYTARAALFALVLPILLFLIGWTAFELPGALTLVDAVLATVFGTMCAGAGYGVLLSPASALAWGVETSWSAMPATHVSLKGRTVRYGTRQFVLGRDGQTITHDPGTLTLQNADESLVITGAAAYLDFLETAFRTASEGGGTEAEVPAKLKNLAETQRA